MSSTFQQEWQTGNKGIYFPLVEPDDGVDFPPQDFLLDLRLFITGTSLVDAFISSVEYDDSADEYTIVFARVSDSAEVLSGTMGRLNPDGGSRVGLKQSIGQAERVCLFTPGPSWDDPTWGGPGSWTKNYLSSGARISPDVVNPGPPTFRRIFIDGQVPDESEWPRGGEQMLVGGYNISFGTERGRRQISFLEGVTDINVIGGKGDGYYPTQRRSIDYVATIHGVGPDQSGNLTISTVDCLRVFQPRTDVGPIPHTIQFASDCMPCCPCSEYRNTSRAVGRRSAKVKDLCDALQLLLRQSEEIYNHGIAILNSKRKPLVAVRNVRALGSRITFSVQNLTDIPLFAYVAFRILSQGFSLGPFEVEGDNAVLVSTDPYDGSIHATVLDHRLTLAPLPYEASENPLNGIPSTNFPELPLDALLCVGGGETLGVLDPILPGELVEVTLLFPARAAAIDAALIAENPVLAKSVSVAAALPMMSFSSLAVYGSSHSLSCAADSYTVQIESVERTPDEFYGCELPYADSYVSVGVQK